MQRNSKLIAGVLALAGLACLPPAQAATRSLTCGGMKTITAEAARLSPGDVLQVSGTCTENVSIPSHVNSITIEGLAGARVQAATTDAVVRIRGSGIRIRNLVLSGGVSGIEVLDAGFAWIEGNTIEANGTGILVQFGAQARIWNNVVQNNSADGILVARGASALIGATSVGDTNASPNTVVGNSGAGIVVRAVHATILGNIVSGNGSHGIFMLRAGQADIASNTIANNNGQGIEISNFSAVSLGTATGTGLTQAPNTGSGNAAYGVRCTTGFVNNRIGTLTGLLGAIDPGPYSCINAITL